MFKLIVRNQCYSKLVVFETSIENLSWTIIVNLDKNINIAIEQKENANFAALQSVHLGNCHDLGEKGYFLFFFLKNNIMKPFWNFNSSGR